MNLTLDTLRRALMRHEPRLIPAGDRRVAAVLVPIVLRGDALHMLFTRRTEQVEHHRGQISFPGGHRDPGDPDLLTTALRETHEEIGLSPADVEILGRLDDHLTHTTHFHVTPFVGHALRPPESWTPHPEEVAEVLEVPLRHLLDPACESVMEYESGGRRFRRPAFHWGDHVIWGATASILHDLLDLIRSAL